MRNSAGVMRHFDMALSKQCANFLRTTNQIGARSTQVRWKHKYIETTISDPLRQQIHRDVGK